MHEKPEPKRRGRPAFTPTRSQRDLVMTTTAAGLSQQEVADALGVSRQTVIDHFRRELDTGRAVRIAENLALLRRAALKHNVSAMRALATLYAAPADHYGQPMMGKKARREWAAKNALKGTVWEDLVRYPDEGPEARNGQ
jgi:DNA-binding XRE family transcriptional regulator